MSSEDLSRYVDRGELLEALKDQIGRRDVELEDGVDYKRATKAVEGFLSLVLRCHVPYRLGDGTTNTAVIIVKCMPREGTQNDLVKTTRAFPREGTFFDKVFPLLRRASGGKVTLPMPTYYYTKYGGDEDVIFMEDLCARGFRTPSMSYRRPGYDMDHCRVAMETYGRLHALTMAAEKLLPGEKRTWIEAFPQLAEDLILFSPRPGEPRAAFMGMIDEAIKTALEIAKGLDGLPREAEASGKLACVLENTWEMLQRLVKQKGEVPKVLSHGDCWMNNSMFQYEQVGEMSKPVEMKLIDFQMVRYCHPCVDVVYFLYINTRKSFRDKYMDDLIGVFHDSLERNLRTMNCGSPPLTLEKFLTDVHEVYEGVGLLFEMLFAPLIVLADDYLPPNAEEFTPEMYNEFAERGHYSAVRDQYANNPEYRSILDEMIRNLVDHIFPNGVKSQISPLFPQ